MYLPEEHNPRVVEVLTWPHAAPNRAHCYEQEPGLLLDNQREAFLMLSRGDVCLCPIQTLGQKPLQPLLAGAGQMIEVVRRVVEASRLAGFYRHGWKRV